jgi:hypothetical protein
MSNVEVLENWDEKSAPTILHMPVFSASPDVVDDLAEILASDCDQKIKDVARKAMRTIVEFKKQVRS